MPDSKDFWLQQTSGQSLTQGNQSWPVPLHQYQASSHTVEQEEQQWSSGLEASVLPRLPRQESECCSACSHYTCTRENRKVTIFPIFVFYSMFWKVKCICTLLCCLYQCLNSSTARWIRSHTNAPEIQCQKQIHCTWIVCSVVRGGLFLFEAWKDLQKTNS